MEAAEERLSLGILCLSCIGQYRQWLVRRLDVAQVQRRSDVLGGDGKAGLEQSRHEALQRSPQA